MNIQEYIASGILEEYVLGTATEQERKEVMCLSSIYPEIKEQLTLLEETLELWHAEEAETPPVALKASLLARIETENQEAQLTLEPKEDKQIESPSIQNKQPQATPIGKRLLIAASFLITVGLAYVLFQQQTDNAVLAQKVLQLSEQMQNLKQKAKEGQEAKQKAEKLQMLLASISDENTKQVKLNGTENFPSAKATVIWNKEKGVVYANVAELPPLPKDKQYQLWTLVDGKPKNAGLIPADAQTADWTEMLPTTDKVGAFAITIEPIGGSESPTLEQLTVIGELS